MPNGQKDHRNESLTEQIAAVRKIAEAEGYLTASDFLGEWLFLKESNKRLDNSTEKK